MSGELATIEQRHGSAVATESASPMMEPIQIVRRAAAIQALRAIMVEGVDYGKIPGSRKPSLFQPGAEKIASLFKLRIETDFTCDESGGEIRYAVTARAYHYPTGTFLGSTIGTATSDEEKYAWRGAGRQEFDATPEDRRRTKYERDGRTTLQVRQDPASQRVTLVGMAEKRALVRLVRRVTAASDVFDVELEDLNEYQRAEMARRSQSSQEPEREPIQAETDDGPGEEPSALLAAIERAPNADELVLLQDRIRDVRDPAAVRKLRAAALAKAESFHA